MSGELESQKQRGWIRAIPHLVMDKDEGALIRLMMAAGVFTVLDGPMAALLAFAGIIFPPLLPFLGTIATALAAISVPDNLYAAAWVIVVVLFFRPKLNEHRYLP